MEWNDAIDLSKRKFSSRLIVQRALTRGWQVCGFKSNLAIFLLYIPGRDKPVQIFSASPPQMSYPASKIAKDKYITNRILEHNDLPVPKEVLININEVPGKALLQQILKVCGTVVVKPLDASHGKGITMGVTSAAQLEAALGTARQESIRGRVLVQQQIEGLDVRVVCIDYQFVDAISRQPASVIGDGKNTVAQLIDMTNNSPERGENYRAKLNYIPVDKARAFLGDKAMARVPAVGAKAQVIGVSNIGMGGVRKNVRDVIPKFLRDMAIQAAKTLELPVCGVDFMVKNPPVVSNGFEDLQPHIIEVNECPMLTMYEQLDSAEQHAVIDRYLDYVAKAP
jgi:cyanophycin synthetase